MRDQNVQIGDRVRDPLDGQRRTVARIDGTTAHMDDGGVMALHECTDILLPGEAEPAGWVDARVTKLCRTCRQPGIVRDAWAQWDDETQQWVLQDCFDMAYCPRCETETGVEEVPLADFLAGKVAEPKYQGAYTNEDGARIRGLFHLRCLHDLRRGYEASGLAEDGAEDGAPCPLCAPEAN